MYDKGRGFFNFRKSVWNVGDVACPCPVSDAQMSTYGATDAQPRTQDPTLQVAAEDGGERAAFRGSSVTGFAVNKTPTMLAREQAQVEKDTKEKEQKAPVV